MSDLKNIRARITTLSLAANLPPSVWSELCLIDSELSVLCAARAADEERVRSVVRGAVRDALLVTEWRTLNRVGVTNAADVDPLADAIATRAAKQLASPGVRLSEEDVATLDLIRDEVGYGISVVEDADGSKRDRCCSLLDRLLATVRP